MRDDLQGTFNGSAASRPLTGHIENQLLKLAATKPADLHRLQDLLASGADLECKDEKGHTPFFVACRNNNTDMIKALADAGAKLDVVDVNGATPLFISIALYNQDAVRKMMECGLHPDHARYRGMTPLMHAANFKKVEIVSILMEYGADHTLKSDERNMTAGDYAIDNNKPHIAEKINQLAELRETRAAQTKREEQERAVQIARESEKALMDALQNQGMPTGHAISVRKPVKLKSNRVLH